MADTGRFWSLSAVLLTLSGVTLIGAGLYFLFLRPPLLPEDLRYMGSTHVAGVSPRLEAWLAHVFRVMGGYVLATRVLTVTLAAMSLRLHQLSADLGALIAGVASIGLMAATNFIIDSDFKWTLLGMAALWVRAWSPSHSKPAARPHELRQLRCAPYA
jgi:hypothetical protein